MCCNPARLSFFICECVLVVSLFLLLFLAFSLGVLLWIMLFRVKAGVIAIKEDLEELSFAIYKVNIDQGLEGR